MVALATPTRSIAVGGYRGWSAAARALLADGVEPGAVHWLPLADAERSLLPVESFGDEDADDLAGEPAERSPLTVLAACHRDADRFAVLYRVWWRLRHGEPHLLEVAVDPDVRRLQALARAVSHDVHRLKAFVRFREMRTADGTAFIAWHRPDHDCLHLVARFFRTRFAGHRWAVLTARRSVAWDGSSLRYSAGVAEPPTAADGIEAVWLTYYAAIFNPARANERAVDGHLPLRFRAALPEARLIPGLLEGAAERVAAMAVAMPGTAVPYVPADADLAALRTALPACRGCPLHRDCTAVAGEGPADARLVLVGKHPGDSEDRRGRPFVGPSGLVLDEVLAAAGVARGGLFLTYAVKHFHHRVLPDGRREQRIPDGGHIAACRPWLVAELRALRPRVIVCLGAVAALAVLGRRVAIGSAAGAWHRGPQEARVLVTAHPAAVLRAVEPAAAEAWRQRLTDDLRTAWRASLIDEAPERR